EQVPLPWGFAMQVRVNMETLTPDGAVRPSAGVLDAFEVPTGPGVRTDSCGYAGYRPSPSFDSLLAKVVVKTRSGDFSAVVAKAYRALGEFRVDGVTTNLPLLQNLLRHPALAAYRVTTRFVDEHLPALLAAPDLADRRVPAQPPPPPAGAKVWPGHPAALR